jgi:nitroimidazol reductase NimA-like FMN-containing flavoprotein (pyridoxamine 5'-phosphate oxidase superfamily)
MSLPDPAAPAAAEAAAQTSSTEAAVAPSARTTVRRLSYRGSYERDLAYAILDEALVCHVGFVTDHGPAVLPMLHARDGDRLLVHGSPANRLLRAGRDGIDVCATVTLIDGLVLARSTFHHSVNYRSVVVYGRAQRIDDLAERRAALDVVVERIVPGRGADARPANDKELKGTTVLALPLDELSVKHRDGGPLDETEDYDLPVWAGVIPLTLVAGEPVPDPDLPTDAPPVPPYARDYRR